MNQKEKITELLRAVRGKGINDTADFLLRNGVRVEPTPEGYDYSECPNRAADGCSCTVLANMICRSPNRTLPCGFFPREQQRRADIMHISGSNCFHGVEKL